MHTLVRTRMGRVLASALFALVLGAGVVAVRAADAPRMDAEELKARLNDASVVVLDVRRDADWKASPRKILGAHRESPTAYRGWSDRYPRDKTIVLYCA